MISLNLPNKLTLSRIFAIPAIVYLVSLGSKFMCFIAALLFVLAALTDLFDGYLARRGNQVTTLGKFLDPLADKLLISSVLIMLVQMESISAWIAIIIICREMMVTGLRAIAADEGVVIAADKYGKMKTIFQIIALVPLILHYTWLGIDMHFIGILLLCVALVLTVYSGFNYFYAFFSSFKEKNKAEQEPSCKTSF